MSAVRTLSSREPPPRSADAASTASPAALPADAALARLREAGLACDKAKGPRLHILGGRRAFVVHDIHGYEDGFAIVAEPDGGYRAMVADTGEHRDEDFSTETLAQAVEAVLSVYRGRDALRPARR